MITVRILFITFALLFSIDSKAQEAVSLKVMTWNIWHGGLHGRAIDDFEEDTLNTLNVQKVLKVENPDILFMQETYCCGVEIAKQAGYEYSVRGSSNLSMHSKYPIIEEIKVFKPFNSHAAIIDVKGQKILCVNIWLHYLPDYFRDIKSLTPEQLIEGEEKTRLKEISAIVKEIDSLKTRHDLPIIIGGDFNSGSHLDWIESTREFHYDKVVEWPVSKLMIENGFIDSFRDTNPDPALTTEGTWGFLSDDIISDRIDYIYYQGKELNSIKSKIVKDDLPDGFFNSDHRAILTLFEVGRL